MHISDQRNTTTSTTIDGILLVSSSWATVMFDTGASYSFISMLFASILGLEYEPLDSMLSVCVSLGNDYKLFFLCSLVRINTNG